MVLFAQFIAATLLATLAVAIPVPDDSAVGDEVAVSAPNGTPISETPTVIATASAAVLSTTTINSTPTATALGSTTTYGSGSSNWGGSSGLENCVQQCVASFGSMGSYSPPATSSGDNSGSSGISGSSSNGATHTVIVAPTQGVLRYVPFAVNASVGDTVMFMWGAKNHTVTKSSELQLCNKSSDGLFATGEQSQPFVFTQVVNDTNPTFFYCGTPTHCEKGMFGVINPPNADGAPTSVAAMMPSLMNDSTTAAMASLTATQTANNSLAANWGSGFDMGKMPEWAQPLMAQNILYTRAFLAANPEVLNSDGSVDLGNAGNSMMIPADLANNSPSSSTGSSSSASTSATSGGATSTAGATKSNGGRALGSSSVLVGIIAVVATLLIL